MSLQFWRSEHSRVRELLTPYIDGRLSEKEEARVVAHLKGCSRCEMELASLRQTVAVLRSLPSVALPRSFVLAEVPGRGSWEPSRPLVWAMQASTGVAALLLALVLAGDFLQTAAPSPDPVSIQSAAPASAAPASPPAPRAAESKGFAAPAAAPVPAPTPVGTPASADSALQAARALAPSPAPAVEKALEPQAAPKPSLPRGAKTQGVSTLRTLEVTLGTLVLVLGAVTSYLMLRRTRVKR